MKDAPILAKLSREVVQKDSIMTSVLVHTLLLMCATQLLGLEVSLRKTSA